MDLERLCALLGGVSSDHLAAGFASLLQLFPESSCESIQLVNVLIPLVLDSIKPFFKENAMVQVNCYFYTEVSFPSSTRVLNMTHDFSLHVLPLIPTTPNS